MGLGKLVFKGEKPKKKKKKTKHSTVEHDATTSAAIATSEKEVATQAAVTEASASEALHTHESSSSASVASGPRIQQGTGLITVSGTVVTGHDTKFQRELAVGDALLIGGDDSTNQEMRVVTMCLSNTSLNISSAFSKSLSRPTAFSYIRKPSRSNNKQAASNAASVPAEQQASGLFGASNELVYQEKTEHGSYRIKRVKLDEEKDISRGDLLYMRTKKKSDKYC